MILHLKPKVVNVLVGLLEPIFDKNCSNSLIFPLHKYICKHMYQEYPVYPFLSIYVVIG